MTPLEEALGIVGDRWTLLVIDALLDGPARFGDLTSRYGGLAPSVLSRRLRALEEAGVVVAVPYSSRPVRHEYRLTATGRELAGALRLLTRWGAARAGEEAPGGPHHASCGTALEVRWWCPTCDRAVHDDEADDLEEL